jgi:hypothetical protein
MLDIHLHIPINLAKKILDDLKKYGSVNVWYWEAFPSSTFVEERYFKQQDIALGSKRCLYNQ